MGWESKIRTLHSAGCLGEVGMMVVKAASEDGGVGVEGWVEMWGRSRKADGVVGGGVCVCCTEGFLSRGGRGVLGKEKGGEGGDIYVCI